MAMLRVRRGTASSCALLALALPLALLPAWATEEPAPRPTAAEAEQAGEPSALPGVTYAMASRSGARAVMLGEADPAQLVAVAAPAGQVRMTSAKGTRVWTASAMGDHGVPAAAARAYHRAAADVARSDPGCSLPWTLLAAVGRVESDHGRYGGAVLDDAGISRPLVIGVRLDGRGPVAAIRDTDGGRYDRDTVWDRAVGPMQFIPATWAAWARDGDRDGRLSPHDLDDAAAAAAAYLCAGGGSLREERARSAAIFSYNHDDYYVALVTAFEVGYRTGVFVMPPPPVDEEQRVRARRRAARLARERARAVAAVTVRAPRPSSEPSVQQPASSPAGPTTSPPSSPKPSPVPTPKPSPKPSPSPPQPVQVTGVLAACETGFCLGGRALDLGAASAPGAVAASDLDGDGQVETNGEELASLIDQRMTLVVLDSGSGPLEVLSVNGRPLS